ncbi:MAG: ABC transporter permease [Defluviitaleaceae bacterium]|nr:ABC transporter permease [Defluviitaleaceae bacterium]
MRISLLVAMAAFCVIVFASHRLGRAEPLFIAVPRTSTANFSAIAADEFSILTYETRRAAHVTTLRSRHDATLIGTNERHFHVLRNTLYGGNFFNRDAVLHAHRVAVLNRAASFEMFGIDYFAGTASVYIAEMGAFSVIGVVDDSDNNPNIYVPQSVLASTANALAVNFATLQDEEYVRGKWRQIGVGDDNFHMLNFDTVKTLARDRIFFAVCIIVLQIIFCIAAKIMRSVKKDAADLDNLRREFYMRDIIKKPALWKAAGKVLCLPLLITVAGALGISALQRVLFATRAAGILSGINTEAFTYQIEYITLWHYVSLASFLCFVLAFACSRFIRTCLKSRLTVKQITK